MATRLSPELQESLSARLAPFDALDACHQQVIAHLQLLARLTHHLDQHGVDDEARRLARASLQFFSETARQHHLDEERSVFPALLAGTDDKLIQQVRHLQLDHGWLEEDWQQLAMPISAIADGYAWYEADGLRHGIEVFTALYHDHIGLEESLIYPEARRALGAEVEGLGRRLAQQRHEPA